jgi:hypothetical protein
LGIAPHLQSMLAFEARCGTHKPVTLSHHEYDGVSQSLQIEVTSL